MPSVKEVILFEGCYLEPQPFLTPVTLRPHLHLWLGGSIKVRQELSLVLRLADSPA